MKTEKELQDELMKVLSMAVKYDFEPYTDMLSNALVVLEWILSEDPNDPKYPMSETVVMEYEMEQWNKQHPDHPDYSIDDYFDRKKKGLQ